ncbi:hypothetical protein CF15_04070 [Pyrodictium occultum]|uniref:Uncharacterized protein n=1 Tax=Pyrodictium occultum TaxID=2309 RepID=A0A0V8RVC8_PYROC|nr:hypothetical protein [Pyrodictium occultum]KSW11976.1 hypothetical protein CF15_04070 [Pyrodictium occultum]
MAVRLARVNIFGGFASLDEGGSAALDAYDSPVETLARLSCKYIGLLACGPKPAALRALRLLAGDLYAAYTGMGLQGLVVEERRYRDLGTVLLVIPPGCERPEIELRAGGEGVFDVRVSCGGAGYECGLVCQ